MRSRLVVVVRIALVTALLPLVVSAQSQSQSVRQVPLTRSGPLPTTPPINANAEQGPEVDSALDGDRNEEGSAASVHGNSVYRTLPQGSRAYLLISLYPY